MTIGSTSTSRISASADPRPISEARNACVYISLAMTLVLKFPAVIVRTMSNTLRVAIEIVVSTTTSEPRMPGTVTFVNRCQPLVPSSCAASICSVGMPLMAAREHHHRESGLDPDHHDDEQHGVERIGLQPLHRFAAERDHEGVEQTDLLAPRRLVLVDEAPDDAGADERDRHRHEDEGLVVPLAARLVDEHGVREAEGRRQGGHQQHPDDGVDEGADRGRLGERPDEVLQAESCRSCRGRRGRWCGWPGRSGRSPAGTSRAAGTGRAASSRGPSWGPCR